MESAECKRIDRRQFIRTSGVTSFSPLLGIRIPFFLFTIRRQTAGYPTSKKISGRIYQHGGRRYATAELNRTILCVY